jgi:hypothetical protein
MLKIKQFFDPYIQIPVKAWFGFSKNQICKEQPASIPHPI